MDAVQKEITVLETISNAITRYPITDLQIDNLYHKYSGLKIAGIEDKKGYEIVKSARLEMQKYRTSVESKRKELKEASLAYGRAVDAEAKRITAKLSPLEEQLKSEESRIDAELDAIKAEKQRQKDLKNQARIDALNKVGAVINLSALLLQSDDEFTATLVEATKAFEDAQAEKALEEEIARAEEEELRRKEAEEAEKRKAEQDALNAERARLQAIQDEQDRKEAEIRDKQAALDAQIAAKEKAEREEKIRIEAIAEGERLAKQKADAEAAQKVLREKKEAEEKAERERQEAARLAAIEAARPDAQKFLDLAENVRNIITPSMATEAGVKALVAINKMIESLAQGIERAAELLAQGGD